MEKPALTTFALFFSAALALSCAGRDIRQFTISGPEAARDTLAVWALSDIQPARTSQRSHFEDAIADINEAAPSASLGIVAGDIVHHKDSGSVYKWYLESRAKAKIRHWFEIPGSHDTNDIENYRKYIRKPAHYSVRLGNLLMLFMGDEGDGPRQRISDMTFRWWQEMVANNQDRIIITVTHAMLEESGLFGSMMPENSIEDSSRFAGVLRRYRVDLWLCGHKHIPAYFNGKWKAQDDLKGTLFVNVSAIIKDPPAGSQSSLLIFRKGLSYCMVRARNHEYRKWEKKADTLFELGRPFEWDGAPPVADYGDKRR